jgi:Fis family transcriptional regulator
MYIATRNPNKQNKSKSENLTLKTSLQSKQIRSIVNSYYQDLSLHGLTPINAYHVIVSEAEKGLLESTMEHTGHNQVWATDILGLNRSTFRKKLVRHGLIKHRKSFLIK